jgi:hypothetical protein
MKTSFLSTYELGFGSRGLRVGKGFKMFSKLFIEFSTHRLLLHNFFARKML